MADELFTCGSRLARVFNEVDRLANTLTWTGPAADDLSDALRVCRGNVFIAQADLYATAHALRLEAGAAFDEPYC